MIRAIAGSITAAAALLYAPPFAAQTTAPPPAPKFVHFSTYFGGFPAGSGSSLAVDSMGRVHAAGTTCAGDALTTTDAIRRTRAGGCDGYVAIYSPDGALLYATYFGGSLNDFINALALDAAGNVYLVGHTGSSDFPTTAGAYDRTCGHDGACTSFRYGPGATYADAFVVKLTPMGSSVAYSSYLGGGDTDVATAVAVDAAGRVHVAGHTDSANFPWTPGAPGQSYTPGSTSSPEFDGFYSRFSADGSTLVYSTYINGTREEHVTAVALDASGAAYVGGDTRSSDFMTVNALQPAHTSGQETWLMKIAADGALAFSTYLGGTETDYLVDIATQGAFVYLTGLTCSPHFPEDGMTGCHTYIAKMRNDGSAFANALTVPEATWPTGIAIDEHDRAYFVGRAMFDSQCTNAATPDAAQPFNAGSSDVLFAVFAMGDGQPEAPVYATCFGASAYEDPRDVALDAAGSVYIAGSTSSADFPLVNPADPVGAPDHDNEAFVTRFSVESIPRRDAAGEVVLYASDVDRVNGAWSLVRDVSAAGGARLSNPDVGGPKITAPLAAPADYAEFSFTAEAGVPYHLWIRGKAFGDHWSNDSVHVQFSDSVDANGQPIWRIGAASGTSVNLEEAPNAGLAGWGWQDNGYGAGVLGPHVQFASTGTHTLRVQVREDGFSFDQIVLSSARFLNGSPGTLKRDGRVLARSNSDGAPQPPDDPPPATCDSREIVVHAGVSATVEGAWVSEADPSAASGRRVRHPDAGAARITAPLATPAHHFEVTFEAEAGVAYRIWMRGRAQNDYWGNDSVFAQFDGSVDASGNPLWRMGTASAAIVNLEDCGGCGLRGWGWQDNGYGAGVLGPTVRFAVSGPQTLRVQTREDGFAIDQIVLSAARFITSPPGALTDDTVILPACGGATPPPSDDPREIVLYTADQLSGLGGDWARVTDAAAAGGASMLDPDRGAPKVTLPIANTDDVMQLQFSPEPGIPYRLWLRLRATNDHWSNDSVWVQFSGSVDAAGSPTFRIGTTSGTWVNLEDCSGCGLSGWGWQDNGYGAGILGPAIYFADAAVQTIQIQPREDGVAIDQIVISSERYLTQPPGRLKDDTTIVPR